MRSNRSESHGTLCICPAPAGQRPGADLTLTSPGEAEKARRFHSGLPGYAPTPLVSLDGLAHSLGVSKIWIRMSPSGSASTPSRRWAGAMPWPGVCRKSWGSPWRR